MSKWIKIGNVSDIPDQGMKCFQLDDDEVTIAKVQGKFYAFNDTCTHAMVSLADGCMEGFQVECPAHGAKFDVRDGKVQCMPATEDLKVYETKEEGNELYVNLG